MGMTRTVVVALAAALGIDAQAQLVKAPNVARGPSGVAVAGAARPGAAVPGIPALSVVPALRSPFRINGTPAAEAPAGVARAASERLQALGAGVADSLKIIEAGRGSSESSQRAAAEIGARLSGERLAGQGDAVAAGRTPGGALLPEEENSIRVFQKASPSVVFVKNMKAASPRHFGEEEEGERLRGQGSGYVWDHEGHIVTNFHVVHGGDAFKVVFQDGTELDARVVGTDPTKDVAVLKVSPAKPLTPIDVGDSASLRVGQKAITIGNPFGFSHTMTQGVVSALNREMQGVGGVLIRGMVQTDAPINPGNSGGPLLDSGARLIGMNTLSLGAGAGSNVGIGFAVPVDSIKKVVPELIRFGNVDRPTLGIQIIPQEELYRRGYRDLKGVVVWEALPGGPAEAAGLNRGDIITSIDGEEIKNFDDLYAALEKRRFGDTVTVGIQRGDQQGTVRLKLSSVRNSSPATSRRR